MNICQRLVLTLGAAALVYVVWTAPWVQHNQGRILPGDSLEHLANVVDLQTAIARGLSVVIPTMLLFWALKGIDESKRKKGKSMDIHLFIGKIMSH